MGCGWNKHTIMSGISGIERSGWGGLLSTCSLIPVSCNFLITADGPVKFISKTCRRRVANTEDK
jgi:hypothetical protein